MPPLKALIFDVDGTLAETERDGHRVAFNQTFRAAGLAWDWSVEVYGQLLAIAGGKERIRFYIEQYAPPLPDIRDWNQFIAELHQAKTGRYTALIQAGGMRLRPGVRRLITEARQAGIRLAIATTSRPENALALLETVLDPNAATWFDVIAAGDIVPHKKPAADIYRYVLAQLALPAEYCLAIEDTEHGLMAATGAGLQTVITWNEYTRTQNFAPAVMVLSHLGEPDNPCQLQQGPSLPQGYLDVAIAASLLP